jgi:hypothetical protein
MSGEAIATTDGTNDKENKEMSTSAQRPDRPRAEAVQEEGFHAESDGLLSRVTNIAVSSTLISLTVLTLIQSSVVSAASVVTVGWSENQNFAINNLLGSLEKADYGV